MKKPPMPANFDPRNQASVGVQGSIRAVAPVDFRCEVLTDDGSHQQAIALVHYGISIDSLLDDHPWARHVRLVGSE